MKRFKKIASILLAVVMVLAMAVPAMAAEGTGDYTITLSTEDNKKVQGHKYAAYQVFSGRLEEVDGEEILSDIDWGTGIDGAGLLGALKSDEKLGTKFASCTDAKSVAEVLDTSKDNEKQLSEEELKAFAKIVGAHLSSPSATATATEAEVTLRVTAPGYYLVKDVDESLENEDEAYTDFILQVLGNVSVHPKSDVPSVTKKVKEKNDSIPAADGKNPTDWQDAADYDIGDKVPFQLDGTLPANYDSYSKYFYQFTDTLSVGLTLETDTIEVRIGGVLIPKENYTVSVPEEVKDKDGKTVIGHKFTITFTDLKSLVVKGLTITKESHIVVTYSATLNEDAAFGVAGNPNTVDLTFSNNPNGDGNGKTPEDKVIVFTFKMVAEKVDEDEKPLKGAGFTLYKRYDKDSAPDGITVGDDGYAVVKVIPAGDVTKFTFEGLDSGDYKIVESEVPAGYNKIPDTYFTVEATYDSEGESPALTGLEVTKVTGGMQDGVIHADMSGGELSATIKNQKGSTLPGTGGMGTTLFYIIGGILVVGAVIVLVSKKRAAK